MFYSSNQVSIYSSQSYDRTGLHSHKHISCYTGLQSNQKDKAYHRGNHGNQTHKCTHRLRHYILHEHRSRTGNNYVHRYPWDTLEIKLRTLGSMLIIQGIKQSTFLVTSLLKNQSKRFTSVLFYFII